MLINDNDKDLAACDRDSFQYIGAIQGRFGPPGDKMQGHVDVQHKLHRSPGIRIPRAVRYLSPGGSLIFFHLFLFGLGAFPIRRLFHTLISTSLEEAPCRELLPGKLSCYNFSKELSFFFFNF